MQNISVNKLKSRAKDKSQEQIEFETMMGALGAFGSLPTMVGLWACACFVSGMIASGGPLEMVKSYFSAITGM